MSNITSLLKQGTGYRSSYNGLTATIFGASSFIAESLVARLGKSGTQMVIAYRGSGYDESKYRIAADLGQMYYCKINLKNEQSLREAMRYSNVVFNFIGKGHETRNFTFNDVHVDGARRLARIAKECGVKKFVHISALNARPDPEPIVLKNGSQYYKSKYYGELAVREEFPEAIIVRPAYVLGEKDKFLNHFTDLQRSLYIKTLFVWDYYYEVTKQPILQKDLVNCLERAIMDDSFDGKIIQAVGPYRYDFLTLIEYIRDCSGQTKKIGNEVKNMRYNLFYRALIAFTERFMKYPPLNWERIEQESTSDIVDPNLLTLKDMGLEPTPIEPWIKYQARWKPHDEKIDPPFEQRVEIELPPRLNLIN